jgi:hypothetical protein
MKTLAPLLALSFGLLVSHLSFADVKVDPMGECYLQCEQCRRDYECDEGDRCPRSCVINNRRCCEALGSTDKEAECGCVR